MTRQAAPPAQRWLLLLISLLLAPWLGQGVAVAYSVSVNPQSGPPGTSVTVTLSDFGPGCLVNYDGVPVAGARDCVDTTTLVFSVPEASSGGNHEIAAIEISPDGEFLTRQTFTFRVTAAPVTIGTTPATVVDNPDTTAATTGTDDDPDSTPTTVAGTPTTRASGSATTTAGQPTTTTGGGVRAVPAKAPAGFAAGCPPRQVALMRFAVQPNSARADTKISATTSWGSVGTCTDVRPLRVLFDGQQVGGALPVAGTLESFEMTVPRGARAGSHQLALVADDDPSFELAALAFQVERGAQGSDVPLLVALAIALAALVLAVVLLVRRRRRRRASANDPAPPDDGWGGLLDVPDLADSIGPHSVGADSIGADPTAAIPAIGIDAPAVGAVAFDDDPTMPVVPLVVTSGRDGSFYLLERQNPHAPRRPNGKRGWYRDLRTQPIRAIVAQTVDPHTAGAAASELATGEIPAAAHVVIDRDGVLDLLPDDMVAINGTGPAAPALDEAVLVMLLAGLGADPVADELLLRHASAWSATKLREYGIPARTVSPAQLQAGEGGLLSGRDPFPWHRIVTLDQPSADPIAPVAPETPVAAIAPIAPADPVAPVAPVAPAVPADLVAPVEAVAPAAPADLVAPVEPIPPIPPIPPVAPIPPAVPADLTAPVAWAEPKYPVVPIASVEPPAPIAPTTAPPAPPPAALPAPPPVVVARADADGPFSHPASEADEPTPPAASEAAPFTFPVPPPPPSRRRPLPTPDELIARAAGDTVYYLVENENPHATLRANGKHGWYYPTRYGGIRAVVLHSPGGGGTAEGVAAHLAAVDLPDAAHAVIDPDTIVDLLPDDATALHGVRSSSAALDLALAYDPARWGTDPAAEEALLVRAAAWAGVRAVRYGIPVRRITVDAWHTGQRGIVGNRDVDPGPDFPWHRFLQLTAWVARRVAAGQPPATNGPATDPSETVRSGSPPT